MEKSCGCAECVTPRAKSFWKSKARCRRARAARRLTCIFYQREEVSVKSGTLGARVGKEKIVVPAGGTSVFPAGVTHRWWNAGEDLLELNGRAIPAVNLDRFLQGLFAVLNASSSGRPSIFYIAHVLWRNRRSQSVMVPPPIVQQIAFPVILLVGRILGKYRGDNWPGSPSSCTGAPEP